VANALNPNWTFLKALPPNGLVMHAADFFASQVGAPAGLSPTIPVEQVLRHGAAVIHPFSGSRKKNWPLERFQELAARLDGPVKWMAGPEEVLPGADRFDNLGELAEWLAGARVYIGNDSGITHLAGAVGTPTVALFGSTDPEVWGPRGGRIHCVREEAIAELAVERVLAAVQDVLKT
jgi:ADP-heptose:LPS heptosyltransferase